MFESQNLNNRQQRFVDEYMVDLNATRAAQAAGYSRNTASQAGWEVLRNPKVAAEISRRRQALSERLSVSSEAVISELAKIAFSNFADFYSMDPNGQLELQVGALTDPARAAAVSQVEVVEKANGDRLTRIKLADKRAALSDLTRHLDLAKAAQTPNNYEQKEEDFSDMELALSVVNLLFEAGTEENQMRAILGRQGALNDAHLVTELIDD